MPKKKTLRVISKFGFSLLFAISITSHATAEPTSAAKFDADTKCYEDSGELWVQTIIDLEGKSPNGWSNKWRQFWRITCELKSRNCRGFFMNLDSLDKGDRLWFHEASLTDGMRVVSQTAQVFVLEFGPWRTLTVDLSSRKVSYLESSYNSESRGEGSCGPEEMVLQNSKPKD